MPTRIEIELTSVADDGSWTWRAAGAREPRGTLDGSILPAGAAVGDLLKVESEKDLDGIRILSIVQPKQKNDREGLLELLPTGDFEPVIQQRATRARHEGGRGRPRRERGDRDRDRGDRDRGDRADRGDRRGPRREGDGGEGRGGRHGPRRDGEGGERRHSRPHFTPPPELPQRPKPKRLRPGKQNRAAVLAAIPEEQRPVAELALQGMAAVRQRLREDNARLKAEDKPEMPEATVLKMAENLLPQLRVADWLDRAEAAKRQIAQLDLRDLRSVVATSDDPLVARDESTRELAAELKGALLTKQDEELNLWLADVEAAVEVGRVVRALRLSAMPPKAGVPFPHQLGVRLGEVTTVSLSPEDPADRWIAVLEAAAFSPVRTLVTPAAAPAQPAAELVATVTRLGPLLPQIAALFGVEVPEKAPVPKPLRPTPRKKEGPKGDEARHGKTASHPGPGRDQDKAAPEAKRPRAEPSTRSEPEAVPGEPHGSDVAVPASDVAGATEPEPAGVPESSEPVVAKAAAPDAAVADAEVADGSEPAVGEAAAGEATMGDGSEPVGGEAAASEAAVGDAEVPVGSAPAVSEGAAPEAAVGDGSEPVGGEAAASEAAVGDAEVPVGSAPAVSEGAAPEAAVADAEAADGSEAAVGEAAAEAAVGDAEVADASEGAGEAAAREAAAGDAEVADVSQSAESEAAAREAAVGDAEVADVSQSAASEPAAREAAAGDAEVAGVSAAVGEAAAPEAPVDAEVADPSEATVGEAAASEAAAAGGSQADGTEVADGSPPVTTEAAVAGGEVAEASASQADVADGDH